MASLMGGLVSGALSGLPILSLLNLLLCAGFWGGPFLAVWIYQRRAGPVTLGQAVGVGALAGFWAGLFALILGPAATGGTIAVLQSLSGVQSNGTAELQAEIAAAFRLIAIPYHVIFGIVGGLAGGLVFRGRPAAAAGSTGILQSSTQPLQLGAAEGRHRAWRAATIAAAIAGFTSAVGACAGALWISLLPGMPAGMGEPMGYIAGAYICVVSPLVAIIAGVVALSVGFLARGLDRSPSPALVGVLVGLALGLGLSLGPTATFIFYCLPTESDCLPPESTAPPEGAVARINRGIGVLKDELSPGGSLLATGGAADVTIWDAHTFQLVKTLEGHTDEVWDLAWSSDSYHLLSGGYDSALLFWDITSDLPPKRIGSHDTNIYSVALSPDGLLAASGDSDGDIKLWDLRSFRQIMSLAGHEGSVDDLAWSPNGELLASAGADNSVKLWDLHATFPVRILTGSYRCLGDPCRRKLEWNVDGSRILSGAWDQSVIIWDAVSGEALMEARLPDRVSEVAWSPDGRRVAVDQENGVAILDAATGAILEAFRGHPNYWITGILWNASPQSLVSGDHGGTLVSWDLELQP
jgi:hypothetical protein